MCASSHPTINTAVGIYNFLMDELEDFKDKHQESVALGNAVEAAMDKLKPYYKECDATVYPVSTILDPRFKTEYYRSHEWEAKWINKAKSSMEHVYRSYYEQDVPSEPAPDGNPGDCGVW